MSQSNISIILVDTQLPENVGLSSRAMFNFGIEDLRIVSPKLQSVFYTHLTLPTKA